jgi:hypothetical protein
MLLLISQSKQQYYQVLSDDPTHCSAALKMEVLIITGKARLIAAVRIRRSEGTPSAGFSSRQGPKIARQRRVYVRIEQQ